MHTRNSHGGLPSTGHEMASCAHAELPAVPPPLTKVVGAVLYLGACHRGSGQVTRLPRSERASHGRLVAAGCPGGAWPGGRWALTPGDSGVSAGGGPASRVGAWPLGWGLGAGVLAAGRVGGAADRRGRAVRRERRRDGTRDADYRVRGGVLAGRRRAGGNDYRGDRIRAAPSRARGRGRG